MAYSDPNTNPNSNNTLYFIVGGLVVMAVIFGLFFYSSTETSLSTTEPAAGIESQVNPDVNPVTPGNQDVAPAENPAPMAP